MIEFSRYLDLWKLSEPTLIASQVGAEVYRVRYDKGYAVLKVSQASECREGSPVLKALQIWNGRGVAKLIASADCALLMEFLDGSSLSEWIRQGQWDGKDDQATAIISDVLEAMHSHLDVSIEGFHDLESQFRSLFQKAEFEDKTSVYAKAAEVAK